MKVFVRRFVIFILVIFSIFLISCSVSESNKEISQSIYVGEALQIEVDDAYDLSSSDESIATVSTTGIIKGLSAGTATIIVSNNSSSIYEITLTVYDDSTTLALVTDCKQTIAVGEKVQVEASVTNSEEVYAYTYSSNDTTIATVSSTGVITGITGGICTISIKAIGTTTITKELLVYVKNESESGEVITNVIENITYEINGDIDLTSLNTTITNIVSTYKESIVGVSNYQYYNRQLVEMSIGTGFIFDCKENSGVYTYYVLTNQHVVEDNVKLKIYFGYDDKYVDATLINSNASLDLALVSFTSSEVYTLLKLGDTSSVSEGDFAIAIGNANGYEYFGSVTFGVISYVNRELDGETSVFLQHDVAINPGNSGGPLLDMKGYVIGINTLKIVDDEVDNMGFAISIDTVKKYLETVSW